VVVDGAFGDVFDRVERRAERSGYRLLDLAGVHVDPASFDVVVEPPRLAIAPGAWERVERAYPGDARVALRAGRLRVKGAVIRSSDPAARTSPAARLVALTALVQPRDLDLKASDLDLAARLDDAWDVRACEPEPDVLMAELQRFREE
jgi:hypothetical protein